MSLSRVNLTPHTLKKAESQKLFTAGDGNVRAKTHSAELGSHHDETKGRFCEAVNVTGRLR